MVKSEQKRQQKLARKHAKDRKRHQEETRKRQQLASLQGQMMSACQGKIELCCISNQLDGGLGYVLLARRAGPGQLAYFMVLVDTYCLGVKQALGGIVADSTVRKQAEQSGMESIEPSVARGLVESAIEFASQAGLKPHADYEKVFALWGDIPRGSIEGHYQMGHDGKHLYMPGPFEDSARQMAILATMNRHLGEGEARFTVDARDYKVDGRAGDVEGLHEAVEYRRIDLPEN